MRQELVWMEWVPDDSFVGGRFKPVPIKEKPHLIWTLYLHTDKEVKPELPYNPRHHYNAFLEDYVHDWNIYGNMLKYYTRAMDRSCWILLEFKD